MAEARGQSQRDRADAREGRRAQADEPTGQRDDGVDLRKTVATALTAAAAGAVAGAAKALIDRRGRNARAVTGDAGENEEQDDSVPRDEQEVDSEREGSETRDEPDARDEPEADDEPDMSEEPDEAREERAQTGASGSDVASMIARAKQHIDQVLGVEPESISGVERSNGSWRVTVEVVRMRKIPESTDILASYAVVLDGDGDLISVEETRRYRRSQADER
ncbi:MAG: gas vesicle protein GvpO [Gaiellaceae bacterium]